MEEKDTGADETASGRPAEPAPKESVLAEPPGSGAGQPTGSSAQGEELPDWLRDSPPGETLPPTASGSEETAGEGSRPEWLEAWDAGRTAEADVPQSEEAPAGQPEPPEWLGTLAEQAAGSEEPGLPEAAAAAEPVLDVAAELLAEEAEPQETGPAAVIPDWVRRMEEAVTDETLPAGAEALGAAGPAAAAKENPQHAGSPAQRQRIGELTHLVHQEPGKYWARIELARLCSLTGDWDGALLQYEELIAGHKMIRAVILDLQALLEQEVDRVQVYRLLGDAYMESDQIDQALDMYRLARQILRKR